MKPTLICAMALRERPATPDAPLRPFFAHGVGRGELGAAGVSFTIYLLFTDGQGEWPLEINLVTVDGRRSGRPLPASVFLETPLSVGVVAVDTGIRITRFGYNFITVDLDGETIARVPLHIYETDA